MKQQRSTPAPRDQAAMCRHLRCSVNANDILSCKDCGATIPHYQLLVESIRSTCRHEFTVSVKKQTWICTPCGHRATRDEIAAFFAWLEQE